MASRGINKAIIVGNVGNDPDIRYFPSGDAIVNLSIATSESWRDRNTGEPQERTEWHRVVIRGKLAEVVKQYVHKGSKLYIEGPLRTRKWQGQDGQDRYTTEIVIGGPGTTMQMLDPKGGSGGATTSFDSDSGQGGTYPQGGFGGGVSQGGSDAAPRDDRGGPLPGATDFDDDIPF